MVPSMIGRAPSWPVQAMRWVSRGCSRSQARISAGPECLVVVSMTAGDPAGAATAFEELLTDHSRILGLDHAAAQTSQAGAASLCGRRPTRSHGAGRVIDLVGSGRARRRERPHVSGLVR
jgi:hypothetical protein